MACPYCQSPQLRNLNRRTELGYEIFRCDACRRKIQSANPHAIQPPLVADRHRLRDRLVPVTKQSQPANLAKMFLPGGFEFTHEAVRDWKERFTPLLAEHIRRKRKGKVTALVLLT